MTARQHIGQEMVRQAFMRVIHEAGFECHEAVVPLYPQHSLEDWQETNRLIAECVDACPKPLGVYLSDEYLSRILLQTCRQRRVRIERAKRELASGKRTLKEIAHDVGFSSSMRMYDVFCREVGMSPSEYRERRRLEPKGGR